MGTGDLDPIFQDIGQKYGIDPLFLKAQAQYESGLDPNYKNPDSSASGIAAFTDATAKDYNVNRADPRSSIDGQARYLQANYQKFKDSNDPVTQALSAYKTGPNAGTVDNNYVNGVMGIYQDLKKNQTSSTQQASAADNLSSKLDSYRTVTSPTSTASPSELISQKLDSYREPSSDSSTPPASTQQNDLGYKNGIPSITVRPAGVPVQQSDQAPPPPSGDDQAATERSEVGYGLGDAPRSIANAVASAAPNTFSDIARGALPAYAALSGQPQVTQEELNAVPPSQDAPALKNDLVQRNAEFQQQYGNDPNASANRLIGNVIGATPVMGAVGKAAGAIGSGISTVFPSTEPLLNFLGGGVESNAVVNPTTNEVIKGATFGNKLAQYAAGGTNAALQAAPVTALTNAGSDTPVGKQLAQNSIMGAGLGALGPAAVDAGIGTVNKFRGAFTPTADKLHQQAQGSLQSLIGGNIQKADVTEYVPGSHPTLAKAAAYAGDTNAGGAAALEKTLSESRMGAESLYNPAFKLQEAANNQARQDFAKQLVGTPEDITTLQSTRSAEANKLMGNEAQRLADPTLPKGTVWQNNAPANVKPALDYIEAARKGPAAGNKALQNRLDRMEELLKDPQATNPQYLYESVIKPQLTDPIEATNPFDANNATKSQLPYLKQMKKTLDGIVGDAAPGFKDYLNTYRTASQGVERLQGLQSLKLVNPEADTSYPTLNKVNNALQKVQEGRQNYDPTDPFKSLTEDDVNKLQALQKDLQREQAADNLLKVKGSNTSQNLQFTRKVQQELGTEKHDIIPSMLGTAGSVAGEMGGLALGHPYILGAPFAFTGNKMGNAIGQKLAGGMSAKTSGVADAVNNLLLSPSDYLSKSGSTGSNLLRRTGEMPQLQDLLRSATPYGAVQTNRLLAAPGNIAGAGNTQ